MHPNAPIVAERLGHANVEFRKARIQDLALDLGALDRELHAEAKPFNCSVAQLRHPKETKGQDYDATSEASRCCDVGNGACC